MHEISNGALKIRVFLIIWDHCENSVRWKQSHPSLLSNRSVRTRRRRSGFSQKINFRCCHPAGKRERESFPWPSATQKIPPESRCGRSSQHGRPLAHSCGTSVCVATALYSGTAPADMGTPQWITRRREGFTREEKEMNRRRGHSRKGRQSKEFL